MVTYALQHLFLKCALLKYYFRGPQNIGCGSSLEWNLSLGLLEVPNQSFCPKMVPQTNDTESRQTSMCQKICLLL